MKNKRKLEAGQKIGKKELDTLTTHWHNLLRHLIIMDSD